MSKPPPGTPGGGIDLKTLWITAASSAAAAYVTSKVWAPGTLAAAAFTPVLVAILREALAKSTEVVTRAVPVKGVVRSAATDDPEAAPAAPPFADDPALRVAQPGEITYHGSNRRARHWRMAIITGLLGFLIAAVVFTVPELVAGRSAAGGGRDTTLFGGKGRDNPPPPVTTTTIPEPARTVTAPPQQTVTVPPQTPATPEPTTTTPPEEPEQTPPVPTTTTPPPPLPPPPAGVPPG